MGVFSQGVALGWHVFGPLARKHVSLRLPSSDVVIPLAHGPASGRLARHVQAVLRVHDRLQSYDAAGASPVGGAEGDSGGIGGG